MVVYSWYIGFFCCLKVDLWWNSGNIGEEVFIEENEKKRFFLLVKKFDDDDCDLCEIGFG